MNSKSHHRKYEIAKLVALQSEQCYRLGVVIALGSKLISTGYNRNKTHAKTEHRWKAIHAEFDALRRAGTDLTGASLYVVRVRSNGEFASSFPCSDCLSMIRKRGVRKVYYITETGKKDCVDLLKV